MSEKNWQTEIKRSLDYAGTSGVLIQPEVDKVISEIIEYKNPLRQNIPRKQRNSDSWLLNRRSAAAGNTVAQWIADTAEPDTDRGAYSRVTFQFRTLLARGKVTRFAKDAGRSYKDLVAEEIEARGRAFKDMEETAMFYGNNTSNSNQPDGLNTLITGSQRIAQGTTLGGSALTVAKLDETIDACAGAPDVIATSKSGRRKINALLQSQQRFIDSVEVKGGFRVMAYDDIPVYASTNVLNTYYWDGTNQLGATGDTTNVFVVDTNEFWVGYMNDVSVTPLSKNSSQYDEFDIYSDEAFVMASTVHHATLEGINA
jgi:hypothetical protein